LHTETNFWLNFQEFFTGERSACTNFTVAIGWPHVGQICPRFPEALDAFSAKLVPLAMKKSPVSNIFYVMDIQKIQSKANIAKFG
jgi:hypothetical protein